MKKFLKITLAIVFYGVLLSCVIFHSKQWAKNLMETGGGLALFLYGLHLMSDSLRVAAGERIKNFFHKCTSNPLLGVLTGFIVTAIIQSSSVTTVMVVGFVNAGVMTLKQAIGIIFGANIGTTVTAQIIAFKISKYSFVFIMAGVVLIFIPKNKQLRLIGRVLIGLGLIFFGMKIMKEVVAPLKHSRFLIKIVSDISSNIFAGVFIGAIITMIFQSSSATVGFTMILATTGIINYPVAVSIVLGDNIGTTITAILASLAANRNAKRAALSHSLFNILGVIIVSIVFKYYTHFVDILTPGEPAMCKGGEYINVSRHIANAHTIFNVINTLIFLPFISFLQRLTLLIIPLSEKEKLIRERKLSLEKRVLNVPALALEQAKMGLKKMSEVVSESIQELNKLFNKGVFERILLNEELVDEMENELLKYLVLIEEKNITKEDSFTIIRIIQVANDLERISDQCENLVKIIKDKQERKLKFSQEAHKHILEMYSIVKTTYENAINCFINEEQEKAYEIYELESKINSLEKKFRSMHLDRVTSGKCDYVAGIFFLDILEKLEKIGDHANNIADATIGVI